MLDSLHSLLKHQVGGNLSYAGLSVREGSKTVWRDLPYEEAQDRYAFILPMIQRMLKTELLTEIAKFQDLTVDSTTKLPIPEYQLE